MILSDTELVADFEIPFSASTGDWDLLVGDLIMENAFDVYSTVGMEELAGLESVDIYPNPATDHVNIISLADAEISIYNLSGQLIKRIANENHSIIDLSTYEKGIYFIRFDMQNKRLIQKLILN